MSDAGFTANRIAIIGAGLLGGSFGLAIRKRLPLAEVIGVSRSESSRQAAVRCGAVTATTDDVIAACMGSELVVVGVPVTAIAPMVIRAATVCHTDGLIIDLGSTKAGIVAAVDNDAHAGSLFVGTHPIAGGEKTGAEHASADLFAGKAVIMTAGVATPKAKLDQAERLWRQLGSNVFRMTPLEHDDAMAAVSHLPHIVASMLASRAPEGSERWIGSGWLDTTRVASGDAEMWTAICEENADAIARELGQASRWLDQFASHLRAGNSVATHSLLAVAKADRDRVVASRRQASY